MTVLQSRAVAYFRTSSAANVGDSKDSDVRQAAACQAYADAAGITIIGTFYDPAVSGADPIDARPAFAEMLAYCRENDVQMILVETASRFARDLGVQIAGHDMLKELGIDLIAADSPASFVDDTPTAVMVRQILGAVAQFEKASLVSKLRGARERKRQRDGKCEGRKSLAETSPDLIAAVKKAARKPRGGNKPSLRAISAVLAAQGYVNSKGRPYAAQQIARMLVP